MKLAHRYSVLFVVVVVVSGGVLFAAFDAHRSDVTDSAESAVEDRAGQMATFLDHELTEQQRVVSLIATDDSLLDHGSESQVSTLESFVETTAFDGVSVVDETGEIQALVDDDGHRPEMAGTDLSHREYVQRALGGERVISEPVAAETGNEIVTISAPLRVDGEVVGTVNGAYHLDDLEAFGTLVSEEEVTSVTVESDELVLFDTTEEGAETVSASAGLEAVDWTITAHRDSAAVEHSVERLGLAQALMGLVMLGTLLTFGGWVYRAQVVQIGRVLDRLSAFRRREYQPASELGGGREWEQIEDSLAELRRALAKREQMLLVHNRILRHNLRNKLNVIKSHAELLDAETAEQSAGRTDEIHRATEQLLALADRARMTERLLDPPQDGNRATDVARVVHERADVMRETEPSLSVTVSAPESVYAACGEELSTAVDELLENVADHAGPEPEATVTVAAAGDEVVIRIQDDGPGIPEREATVVSGEHDITQLRHTVGIGLWLVDWIVTRYDGTLRVPASENGCVVEIELSRATEEAGDRAAEEQATIGGDSPTDGAVGDPARGPVSGE